jgi:hypothetical protein
MISKPYAPPTSGASACPKPVEALWKQETAKSLVPMRNERLELSDYLDDDAELLSGPSIMNLDEICSDAAPKDLAALPKLPG